MGRQEGKGGAVVGEEGGEISQGERYEKEGGIRFCQVLEPTCEAGNLTRSDGGAKNKREARWRRKGKKTRRRREEGGKEMAKGSKKGATEFRRRYVKK